MSDMTKAFLFPLKIRMVLMVFCKKEYVEECHEGYT